LKEEALCISGKTTTTDERKERSTDIIQPWKQSSLLDSTSSKGPCIPRMEEIETAPFWTKEARLSWRWQELIKISLFSRKQCGASRSGLVQGPGNDCEEKLLPLLEEGSSRCLRTGFSFLASLCWAGSGEGLNLTKPNGGVQRVPRSTEKRFAISPNESDCSVVH